MANRLLITKLESIVFRSKSCYRLQTNAKPNVNKFLVRRSHGYVGYREINYEPNRPFLLWLSHSFAASMWCYIYWSFWHWGEEIIAGEYIWPQRSEWTDEELGIPPDEAEGVGLKSN